MFSSRALRLMASLVTLGCLHLSLGGAVSHAAAPVYPDHGLCQATPRTVSGLTILASQTPPAPSAVTWDDAREATPEEVAEIERTLIEFAACYNAGETLRMAALLTDRAITAGMVDLGDLSHPRGAPPTELQMAYIGTFAVYRFADGRIGALFAADIAADATPLDALYFLLAQQGDRWLIDEIPTAGYVASGQ